MAKAKVNVTFASTKSASSRAAPVVVANKLGYVSEISFTRPENTAQYSANDVIGKADAAVAANAGSAIFELTDIGPAGALIKITGTELMVLLNAVTQNMGDFTAHLYNASPTAILDNAAFNLVAADRAKYLGSLVLGTPVDLGDTIAVEKNNLGKQVKLADDSTSLFVVIAGAGTDVPVSAAGYKLRVHAESLS